MGDGGRRARRGDERDDSVDGEGMRSWRMDQKLKHQQWWSTDRVMTGMSNAPATQRIPSWHFTHVDGSYGDGKKKERRV